MDQPLVLILTFTIEEYQIWASGRCITVTRGVAEITLEEMDQAGDTELTMTR
jgi:hypothetical protein